MKTETDLVTSLDHAFDRAQGVIAGVRPEQYGDATPCEEWSVRQLMEHLIGVVDLIGAGLSGSPVARFELGPDPADQFRTAAATTLAAWRTPGVMDKVIAAVAAGPMPGRVLAGVNLLDTATHTRDLAVATGQPADLPEDVATAALEVSGQIVTPEFRTGRFGPERTPPPDANATARLVAFLGRQPGAQARGGRMPKMEMPKPTDEDREHFRSLVPDAAGVEVKPMFGNLAAFVNGNMFMGLFGSAVGVKLAEEDRARLLAEPGTGRFGPAERPMGGYVALPTSWGGDQAGPWVDRALAHVAALPAKVPKARAKKDR